MTAAFTHHLDIRYADCDQQGVVFNAHYLAYVDDAMDHWMRSHSADAWTATWDVMLKAARIVWHGPARWPEVLSVDCGVCRWGNTSFDVAFNLRVGDRAVADVVIVYVSVAAASHEPMPPPDAVVAALGPTVAVPTSIG